MHLCRGAVEVNVFSYFNCSLLRPPAKLTKTYVWRSFFFFETHIRNRSCPNTHTVCTYISQAVF